MNPTPELEGCQKFFNIVSLETPSATRREVTSCKQSMILPVIPHSNLQKHDALQYVLVFLLQQHRNFTKHQNATNLRHLFLSTEHSTRGLGA